MRKRLLLTAALLLAPSAAFAGQYYYTTDPNCGNCGPYTIDANGNVVSPPPSEVSLARWAARKAVESQLDWLGTSKQIEKYDRAKLDALQARVDGLVKWAEKLSNHILRDVYCEWAREATKALEERRATLDKLDVAKAIVSGLPTPPEEENK